MKEMILTATIRTDKPKKLRRSGFVPGVLNESDTTSTSVQFEASALNRIIEKHGSSARLWVELNGTKKFGLFKEIQKNPVDASLVHVTIQLVAQEQEIRMHIPISFHGQDDLGQRMLQVQVFRTTVDATGKVELMPDAILVDLTGKELGDHILRADLHIPEGIKVMDPEEEIFAVIKHAKEIEVEEPEEPKPTAPAEEEAAPKA